MLLNEEILPHYQNSQFFYNFRYFEHTLILTKCLVHCMFMLTNVYYINLILIMVSGKLPPVRVRVWFTISVRISAGGQLSSGGIFLEPLIILPLSCTLLKIFLRSSKLWSIKLRNNNTFNHGLTKLYPQSRQSY